MDPVMRRPFTVVLVALVLLSLGLPATAGKKGKPDVHKPPYKKGAQGGDQWNYVSADPSTGAVTVMRAFPGISPIVGCAPEPAAGWATLTQPHHQIGRLDKVVVNFEGFLDPYAWAYAVVYDHNGRSIGLEKFQGPHAGSGRLAVKIFKQPQNHSEIEIEFGAQLGDSCPQLGGADLTFSSIKID